MLLLVSFTFPTLDNFLASCPQELVLPSQPMMEDYFLIALQFIPRKNTRIYCFLPMIKFANSKFIFGVRGLKIVGRDEEIQNLHSKK